MKDPEYGTPEYEAYQKQEKELDDIMKEFMSKKYICGCGLMICEATSFPDLATANDAIREVLTKYDKEIREWAKGAKLWEQKSFQIGDLGREVGYGLAAGETTVSPRYGALVVLVKVEDIPDKSDELKELNLQVITAYPITTR